MNNKRLTRIQKDHMVAGVCSGLAQYMDMDPTVIRLIFVLLFFVTGPGILLAYLIMAIVIPNEETVQPTPPQQQS
jgi:phage shock protein C